METVRLNIAGREYPLRAPASEVEKLKQAARTINAQFDAFKEQFQVNDPVDLLAMTALHLASEDQPSKETQQHSPPARNLLSADTLDQIAELSSRMERLLEV